jgi:hypothetical protein
MAYLGRQPIIGNYQVLDAITASATATYALTKGGVAVFPQTPANCIVSLNGVIQAPFDSYTISGSNIVFASALTGSDSIDFITVLGDVLNVGTVSDGTITTAKLASGVLPTNTPAFSAYLSSSQTVTNNVYTKIIFNSEIVDTNSAYDTSTGRFTVPSGQGGKYMVYHNILADASTSFSYALTKTYKNGSDTAVNYNHNTIQPEAGVGYQFNVNSSVIWDLSAGDYLEVYLRFVGSGTLIANATYGCVFGAYKIIE